MCSCSYGGGEFYFENLAVYPESLVHNRRSYLFTMSDGGRRVSPISIELREQCADLSACILGKTSTVGA